jgi:hypothetical protein
MANVSLPNGQQELYGGEVPVCASNSEGRGTQGPARHQVGHVVDVRPVVNEQRQGARVATGARGNQRSPATALEKG